MFSAYGNVKATKVISDRAGVSKGYGFVTFETEEDAKRLVEIVSSLL
jgi:RNA recognition motif-containing protein